MIRDPGEIHNSNVWADTAKPVLKPNILHKTLIVVGSQASGKSTLVKVYRNDIDSETKSTVLVDYSYIQKSLQNQELNCYEIANEGLIDVASDILSSVDCRGVSIVIAVDASRPRLAYEQLCFWLLKMRTATEDIFKKQNLKYQETFVNGFQQNVEANQSHENGSEINSMVFPTAIVLCKYDLFEKLPTEQKKWASRAYRYLALTNGCFLLSCSSKSIEIGALFRNAMNEFFKGDWNASFQNQFEFTKPLFIMKGEDKFDKMNLPYSEEIPKNEIIKRQLESTVPEEIENKPHLTNFSFNEGLELDRLLLERIKVLLEFLLELLEDITKVVSGETNKSNISKF